MTFAAPGFLLVGGLAVLVLIALHFLARKDPAPWWFPTARFLPESSERAPARSLALNDRLLLLLRVMAVAAAALGFARPELILTRRALARVIIADTSQSVADPEAVESAALAMRRSGDRVVFTRTGISAGLLAATREAKALRDEADSVALLLLAPQVREEFDAATLPIRALWPGAITWLPVPAASDTAVPLAVELSAAADDPIRATLALAGIPLRSGASVRVVRDSSVSAANSSWAGERGHVLVHWPADRGPALDTIGAVTTRTTVLVGAFPRDASQVGTANPVPVGLRRLWRGKPIAWWADGLPAAREQVGRGCYRLVDVPLSPVGDFALRDRTRTFVREMLAPCGGPRDLRPADSATVRAMVGSGGAVPRSRLPVRAEAGRAAPPWLLGFAILCLLVEQLVRRRARPA